MNKFITLAGLSTFLGKSKEIFAEKSDLATIATSGSYKDLLNKPTIPEAYTLPTASSTTLGGIKVGSGLSIASGVLSIGSSVTIANLTVSSTLNIPGGKIYIS